LEKDKCQTTAGNKTTEEKGRDMFPKQRVFENRSNDIEWAGGLKFPKSPTKNIEQVGITGAANGIERRTQTEKTKINDLVVECGV
jgi:hypothetical protein